MNAADLPFMRRQAPDGRLWRDVVQGVVPQEDGQRMLAGPWGECLVAATRYEVEVPSWSRDPDYRRQGPAGQVIDALLYAGFQRFEPAADRLESATGRALRHGGLQAGPNAPSAWAHSTPSAAPGGGGGGGHLPTAPPAPVGGGSNRSSSRGSSSGGESHGEVVERRLEELGLHQPLPWQCCMNEAVERAEHRVPDELSREWPLGIYVTDIRKVSDGWHEGYVLSLSQPLHPGDQFKEVFLRIWRSQLSYWRVDTPTGPWVELTAMRLCREAGLGAASCRRPNQPDQPFVGTCTRGPNHEACNWAVHDFVAHAHPRVAHHAVEALYGSITKFTLSSMAKLHAYDLTHIDTNPLPRFESWRDHLDYLMGLAMEFDDEDSLKAVTRVREMLENSRTPDLPPALCHFDWHLGNVLCDEQGNLKAVIDWEFAGVADPRLDVARHCRKERWTGDVICRVRSHARNVHQIWAEYAECRFGVGSAAFRTLGAPEPWMAFESALVLVIGTNMGMRAARLQRGEHVQLLHFDLMEWSQDVESARWHLKNSGVL